MKIAASVLAAAVAVAWASGAQALTLSLVGGSAGSGFTYSSAGNQNNVVNSGFSNLWDDTPGTVTEWQVGAEAVVGGIGAFGYGVEFFFAGSESGYTLTFHAGAGLPGLYTENNDNNTASGSTVPHLAPMGTITNQFSSLINFAFSWPQAGPAIDLANGDNSSEPSLMLAFLTPRQAGGFGVTTTPSLWFAFGVDDGGTDDNHDDFMGYARIFDVNEVGNEVPIPAALPLFASAIVGGGLFGSRRARALGSRLFSKKA